MNSNKKPLTIEELIKEVMEPNKIGSLVWRWEDCPLEEKWSIAHGGDEDYVILYDKTHYAMTNIMHRLTVCDADEMEIVDTKYMLACTSHS